VLAWLLGGLNFQIEHHLFPMICHVHYPAICRIVEQTCKDFGVKYAEHPTFWSGVASHYRWLKQMGRLDVDRAFEMPAAIAARENSGDSPATGADANYSS